MLHPLIQFLIAEGGFNSEIHHWPTLALDERFNIRSAKYDTPRAHGNVAKDMWRRFLGTTRALEFKSATLDKGGNVVSTKIGRAPERPDMPPVNDEDWVWQTRDNKTGGGWTHYKNSKLYGLSEQQVEDVSKKLSKAKFSAKYKEGSSIGIVDISDLHTGAVLKYAVETIKTPEFNIEILTDYIAEAVSIINSYNFKEVHLFLPGDIVETFTAFNHKDSWKNVQAFQGGVTIMAYQVVKGLVSAITNVKCVYMVEGNHDRLTADKEGNSRKGIAEIIAFFLKENGNVDIKYHPWLIAEEIDGMYHLCTHGDHKPFLKNDFWFRYGKQGIYNVLRTGHYHGFNVLRQTQDNLHYQCPSVFTGNFFSESIGFDAVPGITICQNRGGVPQLDYRPLAIKKQNV
jgi:predicted phosphodiesterase